MTLVSSSLCLFVSILDHSCGNVFNYFTLHTLNARRRYRDVLFLLNVCSGSKYCLTLLETFGLRMPNRNFRDFSLFNVDFKRRNSPSARCSSAANGIGSDTDIRVYNGRSVSVNDWLISDTFRA